ncbi:unnamed protein product [Prunus armeniaca]
MQCEEYMMESSESDSFSDILLSWSLEDIVDDNLYKHKWFLTLKEKLLCGTRALQLQPNARI